ncbi:MAG: ABC transporter ATP-binding protein [Spirochaetaceae bacterium]|nr:MAG: ABC transporter ATP-binding protein [Spirochaetaceae bacterium]
MLDVQNVTVDFVGLRAVDHASFTVEQGQIVGLIGPNGAGKTTLFNVVSGMIRPTSGSVLFEGKDLSRLGPADRNRLGIGRTFQVVKPFGGMTVLDNVVVGALTRGQSRSDARETARATLDRLRLGRFENTVARSLPLALRKRLEVARALATGPKLLLLDEIMGGLNPTEVNETLALIQELNSEGLTFLVIEHNMSAIMRIAEKVLVLNQGALLTEGPPAVITRDPQVISVYLGEPIEST